MPFLIGRRQRNNVAIRHEGLCLVFVICLMVIMCFMFSVIVGDMCYLCQLSRQQVCCCNLDLVQIFDPWKLSSE